MPKPLRVERVDRQVIEHKLLAALEEGLGQVAVVADFELLSFIIYAARECRPGGGYSLEFRQQVVSDLERLRQEAFGA